MDDADIARHHDVDETFGPKDPKGQCRCLSRMSLLQSSDGNGGALYPSRGRFSASHAPVGLTPSATPDTEHQNVNRQRLHLSRAKRCLDEASHLKTCERHRA